MTALIDSLAGRLVVSCQAYPGEPMRHPETMAQLAEAAVRGGAAAIRAQGLDDLRLIRSRVDVPLIGLWKDGDQPVFITPTLRHARAVREAGAHVVALDATRRPRPDGLTLAETIRALEGEAEVLVMGDCGSLADATAAIEAGVDLVGTTLSGYTGERPAGPGPDLDLVAQIVARHPGVPVIAEGRYHTPDQARAALDAGAHAVVVGTAITHPTTITGWFDQAMRGDSR